MRYAATVSEFMLLRRLDTIRIGLITGKDEKVHRVIENTIKTIADCEIDKDIHTSNLYAYTKNINMAQLLLYCDCPHLALDNVELAADVIYNNYPVMTPSYVMSNRMSTYLGRKICTIDADIDIGTLSTLPNDIIEQISLLLYKHV